MTNLKSESNKLNEFFQNKKITITFVYNNLTLGAVRFFQDSDDFFVYVTETPSNHVIIAIPLNKIDSIKIYEKQDDDGCVFDEDENLDKVLQGNHGLN